MNLAARLADFDDASARFRAGLDATPDERFFWRPSPTARSAAMLAMSVALASDTLADSILGAKMPFTSGEEWNAASRQEEEKATARAEVEAKLATSFARLRGILQDQTNATFAEMVDVGWGPVPRSDVAGWAVDGIRNRKSQLDYLQTIYGDLTII